MGKRMVSSSYQIEMEDNGLGKVTFKQIYELGGNGLLNHYNGSLRTCLQSVYIGNVNRCYY